MLTNSNEKSSFQNNIEQAINSIKSSKLDLAKVYLHAAMVLNDHSPEAYNLLGVISEYKGDVLLAGKYYRAAYAFDPSYKPADKNLEKLTSYFYKFNGANIDFGDNIIKEYQKSHSFECKTIYIGQMINNEANRNSTC
ncbi:MAG TPA: hypothetical protein VIM70_03910 [Clostridium sp.]|uniref:tetratricopeptide repeat protein n=1 Tax=Clostridium sp. TaxID=1506 RepID=UPI002F92C23A